ncbi:MAG: hypothetical protein ACRCZU_04075 [Selenomonadaceae bacterium]
MAERLTKYLDNGDAHFNHKDKFVTTDDVLKKLAAYEDTGLTPKVCAEYKKFEDEVVASGMTFGEVVELMHKKQDGRLVALPCKVGDTAYVVTQIFNGSKTEWKIGSRKIDRIGGNEMNPVWMVSTHPYELHFFLSEFGKTVFLTRTLAEEALTNVQKEL